MRRRKKIIKRIITIIAIILVLFLLYKFLKPQKQIDTVDSNSKKGELIELTTVNEPNVEVDLPEEIHSETNTTTGLEYTPVTETSDKYLISILSNNEVTVLIGNDSEKLLNSSSKVEIGGEYKVSGITDQIKSVYYFNVTDYKYPVFLLLSKTGKLYYVDIETAFQTGNFAVAGEIKEQLPEVQNIYETTTEKNGKTYNTAIITCQNGEGYEFNLGMINR